MEMLLLGALILVVIGGSICGIVAAVRLKEIVQRLSQVEQQLSRLLRYEEPRAATEEHPRPSERPVEPARQETAMPTPAMPTVSEPAVTHPLSSPPFTTQPQEPAQSRAETSADSAGYPWSSVEMTIGSKWLNWVGVVLVTVGVAFFLKYMYDNQWIGPVGRIAIGVLAGVAALMIGEKSRRRGYSILFHALTGGGLAAFYTCIYFSFQVYHLTGQTAAFLLSILVTALAVAMSVVHNARAICLLGQIGGFLSPLLLSTGENHPIPLFSFVTILNLAAMGCAYYKTWRDVNLLAFAATWLLYFGWYEKFYDETQLGIALFFSALFYLMFLIIPTLRAAVERERLNAQNLYLIAVNILVVFVNHYILLFQDYRPWLGLAVITQALTLSGMYSYWAHRTSQDGKTRATFLVAALALVTVAIPIQLRLYGIPIGWAMEAIVLGFIGVKYRHRVFQLAAVVAILLAAAGLVARLPLHTEFFTPIVNRPFGSWLVVIAFALVLSELFRRGQDKLDAYLKHSPTITLCVAVVLSCTLIHMEIATFWDVRSTLLRAGLARSYEYTSLTLLWAAVPLVFLRLGRQGIVRFSIVAALIGYAIGIGVILAASWEDAWIAFDIPFLNFQWISRFAFAASLWLGAAWMKSVPDRPTNWEGWTATLNIVEGTGHVLLVFLLQTEVNSWMAISKLFSSFMGFGFVSTLWSLYALTLIGVGLRTRSQFRRILGFALFGITIVKILLIDMAVLQPVYRILSFIACGALLVVAAYLYQRFAKALLESHTSGAEPGRADEH